MAFCASDVPTDSENTFVTSKLEPELRPPKMENKNLDFINKWVDVTVENEIRRGNKLREEKPLSNKTRHEYSVDNVNFLPSMCNENQRYKRKSYRKNYKGKTNPSTPRSRSQFSRPTSASNAYPSINGNSKRNTTRVKRRCSLRIAELAVPTKRQCIDTWRNKSYILPEFMIERLKQHIMDQRPIVKIPEAINCFQKRRPHSHHQSTKKNRNYSLEMILKPIHKMDTRMLCIIFGHKIAKRLSTPLNLTLNSDWQLVSNIVAGDIAELIKSHNKTDVGYRQDKARKSIHKDVSNKITIWIAGILEDLSYKLFEEDLRVRPENSVLAYDIIEGSRDLEEEEGPVLDFIDDLVDNVVDICEPTPEYVDEESDTSESLKDEICEEESENPVTAAEPAKNATDDSTSNAEDTDEVLTNSEYFKKEINELLNKIIKSDFRNEISSIIDDITKVPANDIKEASGDDCDAQHFRNEIDNIIGSIIKEPAYDIDEKTDDDISKRAEHNILVIDGREELGDDISKGSEHYTSKGFDDISKSTEHNILVVDEREELGDDISKGSEHYTSKGFRDDNREESEDNISKGSGDEIGHENNQSLTLNTETETQNIGEISDKIINQLDYDDEGVDNAKKYDSNVSGVFEIFTEDSDDDKNSKKVKFSVSDLVNPYKNVGLIKNSTITKPEHDEQEQAEWNANNGSSKHLIIFAEPNENLLSDADEPWPAELSQRAILNLSEAVSKSITSLGKIFESDEKQLTPTESNIDVIDDNTGDTKLLEKDTIEKVNSVLPTTKYDIESQTNEAMTKASQETTSIPTKNNASKDDKKSFSKTPDNSSLISTKILNDKLVHKSEQEKYRPELEESGLIKIESTAIFGRTEGKISSHRTQSQMDYGWKVHPNTAPSWVTCGQGRGEPSEDSILFQIKPTKVRERDLRNWCKGLEMAFVNLEMWSEWIDATCQETAYLLKIKNKETTCSGLRRKSTMDWIKLKKNIYKDAILWNKLYKRTENKFKSLKRKYNNIEIVSAEYCMCTCNKTRGSNNTEYPCV